MTRAGHTAKLLLAAALGLIVATAPIDVGQPGFLIGSGIAHADDGKHKDKDKDADHGDDGGSDSDHDGDGGDANDGAASHDTGTTGTSRGAMATNAANGRDSGSDRAPKGSPTAVIKEYEQAADALAQADDSVTLAKSSMRAAEIRMAAAEKEVRNSHAALDAARAAGDRASIKAAKKTYDLARAERKSAKLALTSAQQKLSAAQADAIAAHESLAETLDTASNKDFTDRIADAIDGFFGLGGS